MRLADGLTTRALRPADAPEVCDLIAAAETADVGEPLIDLPDLLGHWQRPSFDLAGQAVAVVDAGRIVAYAEVSGGRYAHVAVLPDHRGRGLGTALAAWTQDEARRQGGTQVGMAVPLGSAGDRLLTALGYRVGWTSWVLALPDGAVIEEQPVPAGFTLRGMRGGAGRAEDERAAYRVVEDAFGEWPDRPPQAFADWAARTVRRGQREPRQGDLSTTSRCDVASEDAAWPARCWPTASPWRAGRGRRGQSCRPTRVPVRLASTSGSAWSSRRRSSTASPTSKPPPP